MDSRSVFNKTNRDPTSRAAIRRIAEDTREAPPVVRFETAIPPSVNHAYCTTRQGGRVLTAEARQWINSAQTLAKIAVKNHGWRFSHTGKLVMEIWAYWPDKKRRDIHNLHKLLADAFEGVLYKDDKMLLMRDMDFTVDRQRPRVEIEVRRHEGL